MQIHIKQDEVTISNSYTKFTSRWYKIRGQYAYFGDIKHVTTDITVDVLMDSLKKVIYDPVYSR